MGYGENRGGYWRGRYKISEGIYGTVKDEKGQTIRFTTKREAKKAADSEEVSVRLGTWRDPALGRITFGEYANRWYAAQELAESTLENYEQRLVGHLLPVFENVALADIGAKEISRWEKERRDADYAESSISTWRSLLHLILGDASTEKLITSNPATKRKGRGKRTGHAAARGPEKAVTTALGILLIAERMALLSGRDDEFVAAVALGFTGIRWGEYVGLESEYVRPGALRVEWQLFESKTAKFHRIPPKDGSRRTIDLPGWLSDLLIEHIARARPVPCSCHGRAYVFRGHRPTKTKRGEVRRTGLAPHHRRSGFGAWLFRAAATGQYPKRGGRAFPYPVPIACDPWPGVPVRGTGASDRADGCWVAVALRLTPHGLRHTHKTLMDWLGTPSQLKDERLGHFDGSVPARYSHVTQEMRKTLMAELTRLFITALAERFEMNPRSPVGVLDRLLQGFAAGHFPLE